MEQWEDTWTAIVRQDPDITEMLKATLAKADLALAILITDEQGNVLASTPPDAAPRQRLCRAPKISTKFSSAGGR